MARKRAPRAAILSLAASLLASTSAEAREFQVQVAPGVQIHGMDHGTRNSSPALVLIPGWTFDSSIWHRQASTFSRSRRVIAIDPRSQGQSTKTAEGDTPEQRAQDLHAVLARLGIRRFVLVGWSQGVQDAAAFLRAYGTRDMAGLVLVDSTISRGASGVPAAPEAASRQLGLMATLATSPREYIEGMMGFVFAKPLSRSEMNRLVDGSLRTPPAIGVAMLISDLFGPDRTDAIGRIDVPTMIVASPRSPELAEQRATAARIPGAEFHAVEGAGHAVFVDEPERFEALLATFLQRLH